MKNKPLAIPALLCQPALWAALIFLLGAALRFYNLGQDSFWTDEAGVAYAARQASLSGMLEVVRSHVMAMPLDYLVVWLVGRASLSEGVLRIPAALWGSLSLLLAYRLFRRFIPALPALLGMLILAISPLHIQYSQELRFYSSLVFFYLLATLLLWDALQQPTARRWLWFTLACTVGVYFHPYVLFACASGLVWLVLAPWNGPEARARRTGFVFSATLSLLAFLVGYLSFSASNFFVIPLMVFEQSPLAAVATGLGWLPFTPAESGVTWLFGLLCALLEAAGLLAALRLGWRTPLAGLTYSLLLQFAAVLGSDLLQHYFFAPRQLLMLLPLLCLFAGLGALAVIQRLSAWLSRVQTGLSLSGSQAAITALMACVLLGASWPVYRLYLQDDKGSTDVIGEMILSEWQPGDAILVNPGNDSFVYKYYLEYSLERPESGERLFAASWEDVLQAGEWTSALFVVTPARLTGAEEAQLSALGLERAFTSWSQSRYARALWRRGEIQP